MEPPDYKQDRYTKPLDYAVFGLVLSKYCKLPYYNIIVNLIDTSYQRYMKAVHHSIYQTANTV